MSRVRVLVRVMVFGWFGGTFGIVAVLGDGVSGGDMRCGTVVTSGVGLKGCRRTARSLGRVAGVVIARAELIGVLVCRDCEGRGARLMQIGRWNSDLTSCWRGYVAVLVCNVAS